MKVRRKPTVVDAVEFDGGNLEEIITVFELDRAAAGRLDINARDRQLTMLTTTGPITAAEGDWIFMGHAGELYPITSSTFAAAYEPAPAELVMRATQEIKPGDIGEVEDVLGQVASKRTR